MPIILSPSAFTFRWRFFSLDCLSSCRCHVSHIRTDFAIEAFMPGVRYTWFAPNTSASERQAVFQRLNEGELERRRTAAGDYHQHHQHHMFTQLQLHLLFT
jgi:hypothetical protein